MAVISRLYTGGNGGGEGRVRTLRRGALPGGVDNGVLVRCAGVAHTVWLKTRQFMDVPAYTERSRLTWYRVPLGDVHNPLPLPHAPFSTENTNYQSFE